MLINEATYEEGLGAADDDILLAFDHRKGKPVSARPFFNCHQNETTSLPLRYLTFVMMSASRLTMVF